jgi:hypothetical protein
MPRDIEQWFAQRKAAACGSKQRYAEESEARQAAYIAQLHSRERLSVYRCEFCHQWHMGHASVSAEPEDR